MDELVHPKTVRAALEWSPRRVYGEIQCCSRCFRIHKLVVPKNVFETQSQCFIDTAAGLLHAAMSWQATGFAGAGTQCLGEHRGEEGGAPLTYKASRLQETTMPLFDQLLSINYEKPCLQTNKNGLKDKTHRSIDP